MVKFAACVAGVLAAFAGAALASSVSPTGWEFAKWGMTSAQVRAASHGAVHQGSADGAYDVMPREYIMGQFRFNVTFDYRSRSNFEPQDLVLEAVSLDLDAKSGTCAQLDAYLRSIYGKPARTSASGPAGDDWSTKQLGDVSYSTWDGKKCTLLYMAYGTANQ